MRTLAFLVTLTLTSCAVAPLLAHAPEERLEALLVPSVARDAGFVPELEPLAA